MNMHNIEGYICGGLIFVISTVNPIHEEVGQKPWASVASTIHYTITSPSPSNPFMSLLLVICEYLILGKYTACGGYKQV